MLFILVGYYNDIVYTMTLANKLYNFEFREESDDEDEDGDE